MHPLPYICFPKNINKWSVVPIFFVHPRECNRKGKAVHHRVGYPMEGMKTSGSASVYNSPETLHNIQISI